MHTALDFVLFLIAVICWALAMIGVATPRINLLAAGLTSFGLAWLFVAWPG